LLSALTDGNHGAKLNEKSPRKCRRDFSCDKFILAASFSCRGFGRFVFGININGQHLADNL
jgi:hypothetical protein